MSNSPIMSKFICTIMPSITITLQKYSFLNSICKFGYTSYDWSSSIASRSLEIAWAVYSESRKHGSEGREGDISKTHSFTRPLIPLLGVAEDFSGSSNTYY